MNYGFACEEHKQFPPMIVASITNVCNLRCIHCYHRKFKKLPIYKPNMMSLDLWADICSQIMERRAILNVTGYGEPFLHPHLLRMLIYAEGCNIYPVNITTNGTKLHTEVAEEIVGFDLVDIINISVDAFKEETYCKIRGGDLEQVQSGILHILDIRNHFASDVKIQVNIIDQPESHDEIEDFVQYWESRVDQVMVRPYYDATSVTGSTGGNITGKQKDFPAVDRWPCQQLWRRFNIHDDGIVTHCCDDWYQYSKVGDMSENTIAEIWQSKEYDRLREIHLSRRFHELPYCAKCTEWQGMEWDYDYFVAMEKLLGEKFV